MLADKKGMPRPQVRRSGAKDYSHGAKGWCICDLTKSSAVPPKVTQKDEAS